MSKLLGLSVSVPGNGHIRREIPCQDASGAWLTPRPCLIVCDGRGSAGLSHLGAQAAVRAFRSQCAVLEDMLSAILDQERRNENRWLRFCDLIIRTVCQQKIELAEQFQCAEDEFDFTISFAVSGTRFCGFFQVGDGTITLEEKTNGKHIVFTPDKGEFDNQTSFLHPGDDKKRGYHGCLVPAGNISGIAITSDGPEYLMFHLPEMLPGPVFDNLFDDLKTGTLVKQDLLDYLTGTRWTHDPRGNDDRSIAIIGKTSVREDNE